MIARRILPPEYVAWNQRYGAPFGRLKPIKDTVQSILPIVMSARLLGPFSLQSNNTFRAFEYPWAYEAGKLERGQRVLEIGGGLAGFQFVLARMGCAVVNVDPGEGAKGKGWPCDARSMARLNRAFGTHVELRNTTVVDAKLEPGAYDRAFSISVLEHLPREEIVQTVAAVYRCLKPGGLFVVTTDLFLDTVPFSDRARNVYGENISLEWLVSLAPFTLCSGEKGELYGYPEFDSKRILGNLREYMMGSYPALAQCLVLEKPSA